GAGCGEFGELPPGTVVHVGLPPSSPTKTRARPRIYAAPAQDLAMLNQEAPRTDLARAQLPLRTRRPQRGIRRPGPIPCRPAPGAPAEHPDQERRLRWPASSADLAPGVMSGGVRNPPRRRVAGRAVPSERVGETPRAPAGSPYCQRTA